jgi:predicted phosphatase
VEIKIKNYDTVIFDLDFTLWDGCEKDFWAKKLKHPIRLQKNCIFDSDNKFIKLQDGVIEMLEFLTRENKKIGFITRGGLLETKYEDQPPVICLKLFKIFCFFNYEKVILYKTDIKSKYLKSFGKTIYIDDNPIDLNDIASTHRHVSTLDRNSFLKWKDLI